MVDDVETATAPTLNGIQLLRPCLDILVTGRLSENKPAAGSKLERATRVLATFELVGLAEAYDAYMARLQDFLARVMKGSGVLRSRQRVAVGSRRWFGVMGLTLSEAAAPSGGAGSDVPEDIISVVAECERLFAAGDQNGPKQRLLSLESVTPVNEEEWKSLRSICLKLGDRTRAQLYTERFLGVCGDNAAAHPANAQNYGSANRDRDRILEAVAAALRNPEPSADFWREVAKLQRDVWDYEGACDSARKAIALEPENLEIRELLISSLTFLKRRRNVRTECAFLAGYLRRSNDEDPLRWARLGRLAAEAEARKQAKAYIDVAARFLSSTNHGAEFELIRALMFTRQPKRAMKYLESLLSDHTRNTWLWTTLIDMAMSRRYYAIALKAIAGLKAIPYLDPELRHRVNSQEAIAQKRQRAGIRRLVSRWL